MLKKVAVWMVAVAALFGEVHWQPDYERARAVAEETHRPIMVLMVSRTCRWCRRLERRTLENPMVGDYVNAHFVAVKVYRGESDYPETLYATVVPTTFFLAPDGEPLRLVVEGYEEPSEFLDSLKVAKELFEKTGR